jgi:hypothetical protein
LSGSARGEGNCGNKQCGARQVSGVIHLDKILLEDHLCRF